MSETQPVSPMHRHEARMEGLKNRAEEIMARIETPKVVKAALEEKAASEPKEAPKAPEPKPETEAPAVEPEKAPEQAEPAAEPLEKEPVTEPTGKLAPKPDATARLARAAQLELQAQKTRERLKAQKAQADRRVREANAHREELQTQRQALQAEWQRLQQIAAPLQELKDLVDTNPPEAMRRLGMDANKTQEFFRQEMDPTRMQIAQVQRGFQKEIDSLKAQIKQSEDQARRAQVESATRAAQSNFVELVRQGESFEALNTIYSDKELIERGEELAQESNDLHYGWDADRLAEELNKRATKDSRYRRILARFEAKKPKTEEQTAKATSSVSEKEPREISPEPRTIVTHTQSAQRPGPQTIDRRRQSPIESHRDRIARKYGF